MKKALLILAAALMIGSAQASAASSHITTVALHRVSPSRVTGTARIVYDASSRRTTITLHATGLTPGIHFAHIHIGHCGQNGVIKYVLTTLHANKDGAASSTTVLPYALSGAHLYVLIHGIGGKAFTIVSCGNL